VVVVVVVVVCVVAVAVVVSSLVLAPEELQTISSNVRPSLTAAADRTAAANTVL
jgi:hypothetical protein